MAKGNFLTTVVRGKLGNMVGYKNTNSNDKETQAWRGYQSRVKNPRSAAQARQRMIVGNLTRNYSALKEIISRGFEGIPYGGKSYQEFLHLNMTSAGNGPYVPKDRKTPVPGSYQISKGSLIPINVLGLELNSQIENRHVMIHTDLFSSLDGASRYITLGEFSKAMINGNTDVQAGDQLTFVCVSETSNLEYIFRYASIILDPDSTEEFTFVGSTGTSYNGISFATGAGASVNDLYFDLLPSGVGDEAVCAGCVVQSRRAADGSWLRSSATIYQRLDEFNSEGAYEVALASYMSDSNTSSDWPTQADTAVTGAAALVNRTVTVTQGELSSMIAVRGLAVEGDDNKYLLVKTKTTGSAAPIDYLVLAYTTEASTHPVTSLQSASNYVLVNVDDLASYGLTLK